MPLVLALMLGTQYSAGAHGNGSATMSTSATMNTPIATSTSSSKGDPYAEPLDFKPGKSACTNPCIWHEVVRAVFVKFCTRTSTSTSAPCPVLSAQQVRMVAEVL